MAINTPNRSSSRLPKLFRSDSPNLDDRSTNTDTDSCNPVEGEARPQHSLRARGDSSSIGPGSLSSSLKTPARSYYQRSYNGSLAPIDTLHNNSGSVREDTAELASRALTDTSSDYSRLSQSSTPAPRGSVADLRVSSSTGVQPSSGLPDIIQETSEPPSPQSHSPPTHRRGKSMLTELIKNSPPEDEESIMSGEDSEDNSPEDGFGGVTVNGGIISQPHERTPLLRKGSADEGSRAGTDPFRMDNESLKALPLDRYRRLRQATFRSLDRARESLKTLTTPKSWSGQAIWRQGVVQPASYLPAVLLGLLLNILDALSYGMILFPLGQPLFADLGPDGISMFYVSCIISQLVYSLGGSIFKGGIGSEMIEVVPFFHKMAFTIIARVGEDNPKAVIATTVLSYALSSILTGLVFFLMGQCKLGVLIGFFPRHILIGCIGGVGFFLVATGLEVSARLDGNLEYNMATLHKLFEHDTVVLWTVPLALAITLLVLKKWIKHSLTDAAWFVSIIIIFYLVVAAVPNFELEDLRSRGWIFEAPQAGVPWYHFYSLYDFGLVDWKALAETIPAMFALTFFGILHVPINIPALGLSTGEDNVDVDRELKAHGYSNALSGFAGSIQNYLVYTNTVLFIRSGGDSRLAGVLLAAATFGVLVIGPVTIGFIPVMVVGTLIFFLGLELMREALFDTYHRVHRLEYLTIIIIVVTMGAYDFVVGILVGIVLACVSFVLQTSRISAIRGTLPGGVASSTVRRHPAQHRFLQNVGSQIYVMKLAGYLFFGTIVGVENKIRTLVDEDEFDSHPIRFLVIDLSKVDGVDFSAAEAFTRINRILSKRDVRMILCGFALSSETGTSLHNAGLLDANDGVEFYEGLNPALEFCENELLKAYYQRRTVIQNTMDVAASNRPAFPEETFYSSPRRGHLQNMANSALKAQHDNSHNNWQQEKQPLQLILQTFSQLSRKNKDFWDKSKDYFTRKEFAAGTVLYSSGDIPNGFYLLETGILKAKYRLPQGTFSEVIVAGATCGELPFFSETRRTSTTFAERDCVTWVLDAENWALMQKNQGDVAHELLKIGLKLTSERMDAITKYMLLTSS